MRMKLLEILSLYFLTENGFPDKLGTRYQDCLISVGGDPALCAFTFKSQIYQKKVPLVVVRFDDVF